MSDFNPARSHIPSLDGIRALAILFVIVVHAFYRGPASGLTGIGAQVIMAGWSGVDLFFVLSGFLITSILLEAKGKPGYFRDFYVKRFGRIFPLYYTILIAFALLGMINVPKVNVMVENYLDHWWAYFLFISNLGDLFGWNLNNPMGPAWSLAVEEQYYLVWPALVFALSQRALKITAPVLLIAFAVLRFILVGQITPSAVYHFTLTHADGILTGSIIALYRDDIARNVRWAGPILAVLTVMLLAVFVTAGTVHYENPVVQRFGYLPIALFYGTFLVLGIANRNLAQALSIRPLRVIGKYSYCIYLIHWPLLIVADQLPLPIGLVAWIVFVALFTALVTGIASVSWTILEKPAAAMVRRLGLQRRELLQTSAAPAASQ
ncbi:acyltransferase family protein [Novosphingobium percolationis]|uniref:acyltransferase family protein n=1 Tax=Novosphingobium percolationis TaxID=2871811 RepID=UPI001CD52A07|nr:acyltransferase [Novosphingobium percolationis]